MIITSKVSREIRHGISAIVPRCRRFLDKFIFKRFRFTLLFIIAGCIEPYEFVVRNQSPSLVVEAYLSDKSFNETLGYPSDGRYFTVKLSETGDVTNSRPRPVTGAVIELEVSNGELLVYTETAGGVYKLMNADFKARHGLQYRLRIYQNEDTYESAWEALPDTEIPAMGEIEFTEKESQLYVMESKKWVLRERQVAQVNVQVPKNTTGEQIFYRWTYAPMWIYVAPLISQNDSVYKCWATDPNYIPSYALQVDQSGQYKKELFSIPTIRNERIFEKFSVLVTQHAMSEPFYNYWKELQDQNEGGMLMDTPPFNLRTNFTSSTDDRAVSGYFGVTSEQARRWYFDKTQLSYHVENTLRADCLVVYGPGPPAEECLDCRFYSFGIATTRRPPWWEE